MTTGSAPYSIPDPLQDPTPMATPMKSLMTPSPDSRPQKARRRIAPILLMLSFCTLSTPVMAVGRFTGSIDMSLLMPNGKAQITYYFGEGLQRMDMAMRLERIPEPLKTTVVTSAAKPDEATIINHAARQYSIVNLRTAAENAMLLDFDSNYSIERTGTATIKGYACQHLVISSSTEKLELWVTNDLGDFSTFRILQTQNPRLSNTRLSRLLESAGIDGFPVRMIQHTRNGSYIMELVSISRTPPASSLFATPADYQRVTSNQQVPDPQQKARLKKLMEKMKSIR